MKIVAIIPAHLNSIRFPKKIVYPILGLPMIEHVRRRALLCKNFNDVIVATCDDEISNLVENFGGKIIMTSNKHLNGTSRVAEAIQNIDCSHVVLLQGDEPLILPNQLKVFFNKIKINPEYDSWNATGKIENIKDLNKHSIVKCIVLENKNITKCFRYYRDLPDQYKNKHEIRKILGLIAYRKDFLNKINNKPESNTEKKELIEQMRIIENGFNLISVSICPTLPSVNEPNEIKIVEDYISQNIEQQKILNSIIKYQ